MTREEAIAIIRREYSCVDRECDRNCGNCDLMLPSKEPILQAYKMAIEALKQEPKTDVLDKVKQAKEEISKSCYKACITDDGVIRESKVLEILDKLIAESEEM